jgi:hypothetical protein
MPHDKPDESNYSMRTTHNQPVRVMLSMNIPHRQWKLVELQAFESEYRTRPIQNNPHGRNLHC